MTEPINSVFRVTFVNGEKIYEVYAEGVSESDMYGFVEIEDLVFGETTSVVVDPGQERLQTEFAGVKRFYIPMHAVIRVDEVEKTGIAKVRDAGDKITNIRQFPSMYNYGGEKESY